MYICKQMLLTLYVKAHSILYNQASLYLFYKNMM